MRLSAARRPSWRPQLREFNRLVTAQERGDLGRRGIGRRAREKSRSPVAELRSSYPVDRDGSSRGVEEPPCGAGCVIGGAGWRPGWWRSACAGQGVCF